MCTFAARRLCVRTCRMVESVGVVGCGLIGTSVAMRLRSNGLTVRVDDVDERRVEAAIQRSGATRWSGQEVDLIVVAVGPDATAAVVSEMHAAHSGTPITDVASVKTSICSELAEGQAAGAFIGGHPISGKHLAGPQAAEHDLFEGCTWVLIDNPTAAAHVREAVGSLPPMLGAEVVWMSAAEHDAIVAVTSHLPQMVASAVAAQLLSLSEGQVVVAGPGLSDVTRLAMSDPGLWVEILARNAGPVERALRSVSADLVRAAEALAAGDGQAMRTLLERGREGRRHLDAARANRG